MEENETNDCVRSRTRGSWGQRVIMRTPAISSSPAQPQPRPEENDEQRIPSEKFFCLSHQMKSVVRPCTGLLLLLPLPEGLKENLTFIYINDTKKLRDVFIELNVVEEYICLHLIHDLSPPAITIATLQLRV